MKAAARADVCCCLACARQAYKKVAGGFPRGDISTFDGNASPRPL